MTADPDDVGDELDELMQEAAADPSLAAAFEEFEETLTEEEHRLKERRRRLEQLVERLLAGRQVTGKQLVEIYDQANKLLDAS